MNVLCVMDFSDYYITAPDKLSTSYAYASTSLLPTNCYQFVQLTCLVSLVSHDCVSHTSYVFCKLSQTFSRSTHILLTFMFCVYLEKIDI